MTASPIHIFWVFLRLGLTSFGGPIAHLGYFRNEFVERRRWLDDAAYADLVALCQFLPGPASSQVGFALGLHWGGWSGALAAWLGFTLPSAVVMVAFAYGIAQFGDIAEAGWLHGLKLVAVAVVAQAVWGMWKTLCPDGARSLFALASAASVVLVPGPWVQLGVIVVAALVGRRFLKADGVRAAQGMSFPVSRRTGICALAAWLALLVGLPLLALALPGTASSLVDGVYRAGSLVFGGGHVVLPLLESATVANGAVSTSDFMAGYGAAQALPGPLFTFAAHLGAVADWPLHGWLGGIVLLIAIFLPAFLVLVAALPFWTRVVGRSDVRAAMNGINAAVVGLLLAALYNPVWTSAVRSWTDLAIASAAFALLVFARLPPIIVVVACAATAQMFK